MEEAIAEEGWTKAALSKMYKLDSFIKETMRMHPISVGESQSEDPQCRVEAVI